MPRGPRSTPTSRMSSCRSARRARRDHLDRQDQDDDEDHAPGTGRGPSSSSAAGGDSPPAGPEHTVRRPRAERLGVNKRRRHRAQEQDSNDSTSKAATAPEAGEQDEESQSGWPGLPALALSGVLALLDEPDVVSVGQACRAWRAAAKDPAVWRHRRLEYHIQTYGHPRRSSNWHQNARHFSRVVRFAPCAAVVACNRGMKPQARKAVFKDSHCQPRAVELNGGIKASIHYMHKWQDVIEGVTLVNPSADGILAAVALPRLANLRLLYRLCRYYTPPPSLPSDCPPPASPTLRRLELCQGLPANLRDAVVLTLVASLEELVARCGLPGPEALAACAALRDLSVTMDSTKEGDALLAALRLRQQRGGPPLQKLLFYEFGVHDKDRCAAVRTVLAKDEALLAAGGAVVCDSCERGYAAYPDLHRQRLGAFL